MFYKAIVKLVFHDVAFDCQHKKATKIQTPVLSRDSNCSEAPSKREGVGKRGRTCSTGNKEESKWIRLLFSDVLENGKSYNVTVTIIIIITVIIIVTVTVIIIIIIIAVNIYYYRRIAPSLRLYAKRLIIMVSYYY